MLNMLVAILLIRTLGMLRCSKFRTGRLACSKFSLEKAMKFAYSGSLTSLIRHLELWEAKYLSQKGFRKRPLSRVVLVVHHENYKNTYTLRPRKLYTLRTRKVFHTTVKKFFTAT